MLKYFSIFVTLTALATGSANAQEREATFQKIAMPGVSFDIVLAMAMPGSPVLNFRGLDRKSVV